MADFGLRSEGTSKAVQKTNFGRGTPGYRAPELLIEDQGSYNNKSDIWALACILHDLAAGSKFKLFISDSAVVEYYWTNDPIVIPDLADWDSESRARILDSVGLMIHHNVSSRPSASMLFVTFSFYHEQVKLSKQPFEYTSNSHSVTQQPPIEQIIISRDEDQASFRMANDIARAVPVDDDIWNGRDMLINKLNNRVVMAANDDDLAKLRIRLLDISGKVLWEFVES